VNASRSPSRVSVLPVVEQDGHAYGRAVVRTSKGPAHVIVAGSRDAIREVVGGLDAEPDTLERASERFWAMIDAGDPSAIVRARQILSAALLGEPANLGLWHALESVAGAGLWRAVRP